MTSHIGSLTGALLVIDTNLLAIVKSLLTECHSVLPSTVAARFAALLPVRSEPDDQGWETQFRETYHSGSQSTVMHVLLRMGNVALTPSHDSSLA